MSFASMLVAAALAVTALSTSSAAAMHRWRTPSRLTPWQWQLSDQGTISVIKNVVFYDVDLDSAAANMVRLRKSRPGVDVICYISVGTYEPERAGDDLRRRGIKKADWNGLKGKSYGGAFASERWLDIRDPRVKVIMRKRFDYAEKIGCDGIEPDNTGAYQENTGFPLKKADSLAYSQWISSTVHARNMSVGLKNTMSLLPELHQRYDWFLNEQCNEDNSCSGYSIVGKTKAIFGVEYCNSSAENNGETQDPGCYCPGMLALKYNWLIKTVNLTAKVMSCKEYCSKYACPGRKGKKTCKASKASVCSKLFPS